MSVRCVLFQGEGHALINVLVSALGKAAQGASLSDGGLFKAKLHRAKGRLVIEQPFFSGGDFGEGFQSDEQAADLANYRHDLSPQSN